MRAFTIRGVRLGATKDDLTAWGQGQSMWVQTAAIAKAKAAAQDFDMPQLSLSTTDYGYAPASIETTGSSKLPWILGGVGAVVLGVGAYFLLRKKGRR